MRFTSFATLPFVFVLLACGGDVIVDGSASSGAGGAVSTSTGIGGGGACSKGVCPMFPPAAGAACPCFGMTCPYDQCPQDGALETATCDDGSWSVQTAMCTSATQCGGTECTPGFVCAHRVGGPVTSTPDHCIPNPCGASPLACSCATSVCPVGPGLFCAVSGNELLCGCPACK